MSRSPSRSIRAAAPDATQPASVASTASRTSSSRSTRAAGTKPFFRSDFPRRYVSTDDHGPMREVPIASASNPGAPSASVGTSFVHASASARSRAREAR